MPKSNLLHDHIFDPFVPFMTSHPASLWVGTASILFLCLWVSVYHICPFQLLKSLPPSFPNNGQNLQLVIYCSQYAGTVLNDLLNAFHFKSVLNARKK